MMDRIHAQEHAEVCGHAGGGRGVLVTDVCMCFMCVLARVLVVARKHADDDDTHTCTHTHTQFEARVAAGKARAEISCQMNPSLPGCPY